MRTPVRLLLVLAALPLAAAPARAQKGITPYLSLATGASFVPEGFEWCGSGGRVAGEMRAGVRAGRLALEARGAVLGLFDGDCAVEMEPLSRLPPEDGIHPVRVYDFSNDGAHGTLDLRLRYGGTRDFPLVVAVGGGRMVDTNVNFLLASAGFRTPGRVRLAVDLEADWFRVGYEDRQVEYRDGAYVGVVSSERNTSWWRGTGLRAGVEIDVR